MSEAQSIPAPRTFRHSLPVALATLALITLALSYSGAWFAPGDSLAVGRPHLSLVVILLALWLWWAEALKLAMVCLLAGSTSAAALLSYALPGTAAPGTYTLYQKNLLFKAWPRQPLADDILASGADIVTLQEVSTHNRQYMRSLFEAYPTQVICPSRAGFDVAILTRFEQVEGGADCGAGGGLALLQVRLPQGQTVWIASLHLLWPWPYGQPEQLRRLLPRLSALEGPVILAGDFNMVPWGASVARIAQATGTERIGPAHDTFPHFRPLLPLPIDHVLLPAGSAGLVLMRDQLSSDHHGLLASFSLPPT